MEYAMNSFTKNFTYVFGIVLSVAMVASLILPLLTQNTTAATEVQATAVPEPTLPPTPDVAQINFDATYLHPSGMLTVGVPTGWLPSVQSNTENEIRSSFSNNDALSIVEARVVQPTEDITDGESLSAFLSDTWLGQTWRDYQSWEETYRNITDEGRVVIDFDLSRSGANFIARQETWVDNGDVYLVRVVTAVNAPEELKFLLAGVIDTLDIVDVYAETDMAWNGYFDNADKHLVRYPATWELADAAEGLPATLTGDGVTLVVETADVALDSEDAVIDWIENWRSGVEALTVEAVDVDGAAGYEVSYKLTTLDGAPESGLAVLLAGEDNRLHVANARIANVDVDLQEATADEFPVLDVLATFRLFPDLNASDAADMAGLSS
jgi:hypothetical protein